MKSDFVAIAKTLTDNIMEQLEIFILLAYCDTFPDLPEPQARKLIAQAFANVRDKNDDFNAYTYEMLHAGIFPDWHRITPERFLEALYVSCRYSPEVRARMANDSFQIGLTDPLYMLKWWVAYCYFLAHPEVGREGSEKLMNEAFARAALRWPNFHQQALTLWTLWQGVQPRFDVTTIDDYLEALWCIAQHASFLKPKQPEVQQQLVANWPVEMLTVIQ